MPAARSLVRLGIALLALFVFPERAHAQAGHSSSARSLASDSASDRPAGRVGKPSVATLATGVIAATVALVPLDRRLTPELREPASQHMEDLRETADVFAFLGGPGPFLVGGGLMLGGTITQRPAVTASGSNVIESVLLASGI